MMICFPHIQEVNDSSDTISALPAVYAKSTLLSLILIKLAALRLHQCSARPLSYHFVPTGNKNKPHCEVTKILKNIKNVKQDDLT